MSQVLPIFAASMIGVLPVEVWVGILRFLDQRSLLSCVRSNPFFLSVCKGDPVLRRQVRLARKEERDLAARIRNDPRSLITITRNSQGNPYAANVAKQVDHARYVEAYRRVQHVLVPQEAVGFDRRDPRTKWYLPGEGVRVKRKNLEEGLEGKPIRRSKTSRRNNPMRC